jgi:DNA repair photolyase
LEICRCQVDPYIGCEHHCYYCYAHNGAETDWLKEILIHPEFVERFKIELSGMSPQVVYFGWNSDPYQPIEATYGYTRKALQQLAIHGSAACILTKSDLVLRDMDLLTSMAGSSVGFSIAFQDEGTRLLFEVNAPSNRKRVEALNELKAAGIETYTLITPVMPFITNVEALIETVGPCADTIWIYSLSMDQESDRNWQFTSDILASHFPHLLGPYREIAFASDHPYWTNLRDRLLGMQREKDLDLRIHL